MPVTAPLLPVSKTWTGYSTAACSSWSRIPLLSFKLYALTVFCRRYSQRRLEYLHEMFLILIAYRLTDLVDTHISCLLYTSIINSDTLVIYCLLRIIPAACQSGIVSPSHITGQGIPNQKNLFFSAIFQLLQYRFEESHIRFLIKMCIRDRLKEEQSE